MKKTAILDKNNIEEYIKNKKYITRNCKNCDEQYNLDMYNLKCKKYLMKM